MQVAEEYRKHFQKPFKEIPSEVLKAVKEQFTVAFQAALKETVNRSVDLNVFMRQRPYLHPVADSDRLTWAALHDERIVLTLMQPDIPEVFRAEVRPVFG